MLKTLIITLFITSYSFSQQLEATPNGLRDKSNLNNPYVVIVDSAKSSKELYQNAINYIKINYKNPDEVIKSSIEGSYLKFETYSSSFIKYKNSGVNIPISVKFTTELKFKDGKVRFEIINLDMKGMGNSSNYNLLFSGGMMSGFIIYKKNGTLFKEQAKIDVEKYFNSFVLNLKNGISLVENNEEW